MPIKLPKKKLSKEQIEAAAERLRNKSKPKEDVSKGLKFHFVNIQELQIRRKIPKKPTLTEEIPAEEDLSDKPKFPDVPPEEDVFQEDKKPLTEGEEIEDESPSDEETRRERKINLPEMMKYLLAKYPHVEEDIDGEKNKELEPTPKKPLKEILLKQYGSKIDYLKIGDKILANLTEEQIKRIEEKFHLEADEKHAINKNIDLKEVEDSNAKEYYEKLERINEKVPMLVNSIPEAIKQQDNRILPFKGSKEIDGAYYKETTLEEQPPIYETESEQGKVFFQEITSKTDIDKVFKDTIKQDQSSEDAATDEAFGLKITIEPNKSESSGADQDKTIPIELLAQAMRVGFKSGYRDILINIDDLELLGSYKAQLKFLEDELKPAAEAGGFNVYIGGMPDPESEEENDEKTITSLDDAIEILRLSLPSEDEEEVDEYSEEFEEYLGTEDTLEPEDTPETEDTQGAKLTKEQLLARLDKQLKGYTKDIQSDVYTVGNLRNALLTHPTKTPPSELQVDKVIEAFAKIYEERLFTSELDKKKNPIYRQYCEEFAKMFKKDDIASQIREEIMNKLYLKIQDSIYKEVFASLIADTSSCKNLSQPNYHIKPYLGYLMGYKLTLPGALKNHKKEISNTIINVMQQTKVKQNIQQKGKESLVKIAQSVLTPFAKPH